MKVFITGATGYIGGSVANSLQQQGHEVRGLVRTVEKAGQLAGLGIAPVLGDLDDHEILSREARSADAVINAASADHVPSIESLIAALTGSGKTLIHTSGTSVIGDDAAGERSSDLILDESSDLKVHPEKQSRRDLDLAVLRAAASGVRSVVICPSLVYGVGSGLASESLQVPFLVRNARDRGVVQIVGAGRNRWSTVHIDDLRNLYGIALTGSPAGRFYFAESGESSFAEIADAIGQRLQMRVESLPVEAAAELWGRPRAQFTFGSNCRVRALRARDELGWLPKHHSVIEWINEAPDL